MRKKAAFLCSTLLLPLFSCSVGGLIAGKGEPAAALAVEPYYDYSVFFRAFHNQWVGRSRDELLAALGPPDAMYEARHRYADFDAGIPAITYVYVGAVGHCLDAYVIDEPTRTVIKYYCR